MASFQKYDTKEGQKWMFVEDIGIDPKTGKRQQVRRRGFKTKKEAQLAAAKLKQDVHNGSFTNIDFTFNDVYNQWFEQHSKTIKPSTLKAILSKFKKHILPNFGYLKVKDITRAYCQQVINEIAEEIKSVNDIKIQANQVFKYALKMELISKNPMEHVIIPKKQEDLINTENIKSKRNFWDKSEVKRFQSLAQKELPLRDQVLFHLLIYTGCRKGEALSLLWDDINFEEGTIHFTKTLFSIDGKFIFQTAKTADSKRLISIDGKTMDLLKKWRIKQLEAKLASSNKSVLANLVFTREDGKPLRLAYPNDKLKSLIIKHDLHPITIHGLRHTHASLLFEAGASIKEVQERLGHTDIQMTMNVYTHVTNTLREQTAKKFQEYIEL